jgi:hypothetical protein
LSQTNGGDSNIMGGSFYKSRFSPYHNYQSLKNVRQSQQHSKFSNGNHNNINSNESSSIRNLKLETSSLAPQPPPPPFDSQNMVFFNSPNYSVAPSSSNEAAVTAAAVAATAALFPSPSMLYPNKSHGSFNPFKNISLNLSDNFYDPSLSSSSAGSSRNNMSSGYCSLDENNSFINGKSFNTSQNASFHFNHTNTPITSNNNNNNVKLQAPFVNSSASLAHIMNWIKNEPSTEHLVDLTSRILLSAIKWTKTQRNFLNLPLADQVLLINENISELYILQMAENKSAYNESEFHFLQDYF